MEEDSKRTRDLGPDRGETPAAGVPLAEATPPQPRRRVSDERIASLIEALGDPQHPLHLDAEEELIENGAAAVPALIAALNPDRPWLTSYRAAEALGQIGDGRASGPLIQALNHPNSNVRWSAVRALAQVGDTRAILPLRRVARHDRGKTSWGESVASTAQAALDQMQARSALVRLGDPAKTAVLVALTLAAVIIAVNKYNELRSHLRGEVQVAIITPTLPTATPPEEGEGTESGEQQEAVAVQEEEQPTPTSPAATPTSAPASTITANVRENANVRDAPGTEGKIMGQVLSGQQVRVQGIAGDWYLISFDDSRGWVYRTLLSQPSGPVPTVVPGQGTGARP